MNSLVNGFRLHLQLYFTASRAPLMEALGVVAKLAISKLAIRSSLVQTLPYRKLQIDYRFKKMTDNFKNQEAEKYIFLFVSSLLSFMDKTSFFNKKAELAKRLSFGISAILA
jgi:hypothetical protein